MPGLIRAFFKEKHLVTKLDCLDIGERKRRRPSDGYGRAEATPSFRRLWASGSDAVLQTAMPGNDDREKCDADCFSGNAVSYADERLVRLRRRHRCRQGKGRTVCRLSWRSRYFANREHPLARGPAGSVHSMAARLF